MRLRAVVHGRKLPEGATPVRSCARCGKDHSRIIWKKFQRPVYDDDGQVWTHWAPCPTNGDPILMTHVAGGGTT